ncbi:FecR domain-containing protein [Chitinophaga sp.]|uniref:FecR family protein n=1 Tax=Chitinophaga sp. TaxID=1869181 RepID=UPI0031DC8C49
MDQEQYTVADLMTNPSFRAWASQSDEQARAHWEQWLAAHPDRREDVNTAFTLLSILKENESGPAHEDILEMQERFDTALGHHRRISMYRWTAAAASLLLLVATGLLLNNRSTTIHAGIAMTKEVKLPDGSKVLLNSNSTLQYKGHEVWIEGEAYFSGEHHDLKVHTGGLDVAVLGTAFNIYSRRQHIEVLLESGKVNVTGAGWAKNAGTLHLTPGEMIRLDATTKKMERINPASFTSWKNGRLIFKDTPLYKVAAILEENYGFHVQWKSTKLQMERFSGSCPLNNTDILLAAIRSVYNDQLSVQANHTIVFE